MNKTLAIIAIVVAAGLLTLGMIFLCAATQEPVRLLVAAPLLLVGAGLAVWAGLTLRRARDLDPENLSDRITQLARAGDAEVTLAQVVAELGVPDEKAIAALNLLERRGQCHRELVERRCPYCGAEFSVKQAVYKCPNCGGDLRLERE